MTSIRLFLIVCNFFLFIGFGFAQQSQKISKKQIELRNYREAIPLIQQELSESPGDYNKMFMLGKAYYIQNKPKKSINWLTKALDNGLQNEDAILLLGHCLKMTGEWSLAMQQYEVYKKFNPEVAVHFIRSCEYAEYAMQSNDRIEVKPIDMNSDVRDMYPFVHKKKLIFASDRKDIKRLILKKDLEPSAQHKVQLFESKIMNQSEVNEPVFLRSDIKEIFNYASLSISNNGTVAYTKGRFDKGNRVIANQADMSIYFGDITSGLDWDEGHFFNHNISGYSNGFPYLSPDGKTLFFSSNRPGGYGGFDIYVSQKMGAVWSKPVNMGPEINSPGNEITPFIHNKELYFSSDWHIGLGGFDIFRALVDSEKNWHVFNLGAGPNSAMDDYGLVFDQKSNQAYFCTNRNRISKEDIYYAQITYQNDGESYVAQSIQANTGQNRGGEKNTGIQESTPLYKAEVSPESTHKSAHKYSIQVGSFASATYDQKKIEQQFPEYDLYENKLGDVIKVRIGNYQTRTEVEQRLIEVKESFPGAFIVKSNQPITEEPMNVENDSDPSPELHKIRLGAYKEPKWFDPTGLNKYGKIRTLKKGDLTIFVLEVKGSRQHAEQILKELKASEKHQGARLVHEVNGQFRYLSE